MHLRPRAQLPHRWRAVGDVERQSVRGIPGRDGLDERPRRELAATYRADPLSGDAGAHGIGDAEPEQELGGSRQVREAHDVWPHRFRRRIDDDGRCHLVNGRSQCRPLDHGQQRQREYHEARLCEAPGGVERDRTSHHPAHDAEHRRDRQAHGHTDHALDREQQHAAADDELAQQHHDERLAQRPGVPVIVQERGHRSDHERGPPEQREAVPLEHERAERDQRQPDRDAREQALQRAFHPSHRGELSASRGPGVRHGAGPAAHHEHHDVVDDGHEEQQPDPG